VIKQSNESIQSNKMAKYIQEYFTNKLLKVSEDFGDGKPFEKINWLRNNGINGGGDRLEGVSDIFNRASVNVSGVYYNNDNDRPIASADAISTIIHPSNPNAPSIHMHFSYTKPKKKNGYFRVMADLNPSINDNKYKSDFENSLKKSTNDFYDLGSKQGDMYFKIPSLNRTRGIKHFYLDGFNNASFEEDLKSIQNIATSTIDTYISILNDSLKIIPSKAEYQRQIDYHSLYFLQVLTLDKGTTAGLLANNENDLGVMASIPKKVNATLLQSWVSKLPYPQNELLESLINCLDNDNIATINDKEKLKFTSIIREFYSKYPEALSLQANTAN